MMPHGITGLERVNLKIQKLLHTSDVGKPFQRDYKKHFIGKLPHRKKQGQK
jgi:hypothetical protein